MVAYLLFLIYFTICLFLSQHCWDKDIASTIDMIDERWNNILALFITTKTILIASHSVISRSSFVHVAKGFLLENDYLVYSYNGWRFDFYARTRILISERVYTLINGFVGMIIGQADVTSSDVYTVRSPQWCTSINV